MKQKIAELRHIEKLRVNCRNLKLIISYQKQTNRLNNIAYQFEHIVYWANTNRNPEY